VAMKLFIVGTRMKLLPNAEFERTFLAAGDFVSMPPPDARFTFRVSEPFGAENIWLIASDQPLPDLPYQNSSNGVARLEGDISSIRKHLRDHSLRNQFRYGEASVDITTQP